MSIQSEVERISTNVQNTLEAIRQTGVSVPENATSDALPAAAASLANEKQDKLTGASGQIVGFGEDGSAQPEDFPGLTQAQGDERYLSQTGGTVTGQLRIAMTETGGALYFGESISGDDGMITSSNGTMGISVGTTAGNRVMMALYESTGELAFQVKKGSAAGNFRFSPNGLDMRMKPILNCPSFPLAFGPQTVASSAWASDDTYPDYPYRASIVLSGVTANHVPSVNFNSTDALSGKLSPISESYNGGVYIYATEALTEAVSVGSITCIKAVSA